MDSKRCIIGLVLIILTVVNVAVAAAATLQVDEEESESSYVMFMDSPTHHYLLRSPPPHHTTQTLSSMEVAAAISILLGLTPPPSSAASSSKLNQLLMPNPFHRPRHVFVLHLHLPQDSVYPNPASFPHSVITKLITTTTSTPLQIQLPATDQVAYYSLDEPHYPSITDQHITHFAQSFAGSYIPNDIEPLNGELVIPLPTGSNINLHMSKKADRDFATSLIHLTENIQKVIAIRKSISDVAELVGGYFDGLKSLQEEYGSKDVSFQATELLLTVVSKVFDSLHAEHEGQIVGVILFNKAHFPQSQKMLDVKFDSRPSPRWLEEVKTKSNSTAVYEVALVRITLAWISGIVLLIATIIGIYLLVNMPLTKDTLLYSNVKLD